MLSFAQRKYFNMITIASAIFVIALVAQTSARPQPMSDNSVEMGKVAANSLTKLFKRDVVERTKKAQMFVKAIEYSQMISNQYTCSVPQPRVIALQQLYPSATVQYATQSVVLHRCAFDTGCCAVNEACAPVPDSIVDVEIPILMLDGKTPLAEVRSFKNHTQCHCISNKELAYSTV